MSQPDAPDSVPAPPRAPRWPVAAAWAIVLGAIYGPVIMAAVIGVLVMLAR